MDVDRLSVTLFADGAKVEPSEFIPIFHRFIQARRLSGLWIDVTDYSHVFGGPGVLLIGHEADLGVESSARGLALRYTQKRTRLSSAKRSEGFEIYVAGCVEAAWQAAHLLEKELSLLGRLVFDVARVRLQLMDRLHAPDTPETRTHIEPLLRAVGQQILKGRPFALEWVNDDEGGCLGVEWAARPPTV